MLHSGPQLALASWLLYRALGGSGAEGPQIEIDLLIVGQVRGVLWGLFVVSAMLASWLLYQALGGSGAEGPQIEIDLLIVGQVRGHFTVCSFHWLCDRTSCERVRLEPDVHCSRCT